MAHFAQLDDNNYVLQVIVVSDEDAPTEEAGVEFCRALLGTDTNWKQTSYSGSFRRQFAGIGYQYIPERDVFLEPMPHDGFTYVLDKESYTWVSTNKPPIYIGFSPSPADAVSTLFSNLKLSASDKFVDLGCGNGRIAIAAAKCGMQATGVEVNPVLYRQSQIEAELANVSVTFIQGDLVSADLTPYTVIYMYLGRPLCEAALPSIKKLAPGKIVISGDYCYPNWEPIATYVIGGVTFYVWKT